MQKNDFKEQFSKTNRPQITDLQMFWDQEIYMLFREFAEYILQKYDLRFGTPLWTERYGWTYRIGKSGVYLVKGIRIVKNGFVINDVEICDRSSYCLLLKKMEELYRKNEAEFISKISEKNARQAERNKQRIAREKEEKNYLKEQINPDKYNIFRWSDKLDIYKLKKLYQLDARGAYDEFLADEIGLTLFLRCKYGKSDMELMEKNQIRCHGCNRVLDGETDFRQCECGYQYSYREYRRSFRRNNMPTGAAEKTFDNYMKRWSVAKSYNEKIILIDTLLHAFHLSLVSGATHRPVAMNFLDGTREQVERVISHLAYDNR